MFRYIAFSWNVADEAQANAAKRLQLALDIDERWNSVLQAPGHCVYMSGSRPGVNDAYRLLPAAIYVIALISGRLAADVRTLLASKVEQRLSANLHQRFFAHLQRLPMAYLVNQRGGELLHSVELAAASARSISSHLTTSIAPVLIELALMTVILAQLDEPRLVALFVATAVLYLAVFVRGIQRQLPAIAALSTASLEVQAQLNDGIAHAETLRCFGAADQAQTSLQSALSLLVQRWTGFHRLAAQNALAASMVLALTLMASFAITIDAVAKGSMTVGGFVLASVYMLQTVRPLESMGISARELSRALGFMQPVLKILAEPPETQASAQTPAPVACSSPCNPPPIRFENLHFCYVPGRPVIQSLDLDIPAGRTTAIVGRSGSGKSSLARLLMRLYRPQAGRILVDGRPIEAFAMAELRAMVALVPQDAGLLHATVAGNIALGVPAATRQDVETAATRAQIHQAIAALPMGYDSMLGERGQTLSGGERQRLAIARALLRRPSIYVLDEPTSMLDSKTEDAVLRSLRALTAGCTTLFIAHRLSTVMHADQIVVLEDGRVRERGRHDELLARQGLYAQLWRQQTGRSE
ncbi:ABC transporter ATP-binding protein [Pelomonas aquatica]|jgi:ABC-type multidrug transport system fused ATPase/permease subunit|uniref:ABC transporter ATP-binding protein n=1 Tax=Pelomonas aquatica TaxID=431058 RepID=A0A9X4R5W9_9BURK|nr:ABC transporter ATP-binding protein [Pelomonas aquatica]MCY4754627.1 ABC transporter ATP-binding protein [Pelomonas aquatica]MDG0863714.1 ABC transporter ATP-binding protein [Pelomonas aquatica]